ncbi:hypothetical protein Goklo_002733 [Gossypium klotzschianum]|uniref:Uncharacterized protein n=2 Tax=Gossypium TaxID=3633 RepID=A0A7J8VU54_9ROSI|nr:hypothetical protein [Gossypium klotzschianum]
MEQLGFLRISWWDWLTLLFNISLMLVLGFLWLVVVVLGVGSPKEQEEKKKGVKKAILGVLFKICMVALYVEGVAAPNPHLGGFDREGLVFVVHNAGYLTRFLVLCASLFSSFSFKTLISTGVFVVSLSLWFSQRRSRVCLVFGGWFIHCSLAYLSSSMVDDINVLLERLNFSEKVLKWVTNTNMKSANIQGYEAWVVGKIMSGEKVNREVMYRVLKYLWFTKEEVNFVALNE